MARARILELVAQEEMKLGRTVLGDGQTVQTSLELRSAVRDLLNAAGIAVEEEDEAGVRRISVIRSEEAAPVPSAASTPSQRWYQSIIDHYARTGMDPADRSGRRMADASHS
ncbi:MAG: hypothetical protein PHE68_03565 [Candidatus Peribacteraceae bacterium]|nr:hypothetical protein [Candidatus Peribacteraceae bacterium]MDD5074701.1 hypothetical protein [Candidatus Peribacteraceae bacterium]